MSDIKRLWNRNFAILWQGQLISDFGNAAFSVALGFWVLAQTKSTALMGVILACFSIPRVLVGPFAGAIADRMSRKWIILLADLMRGLLFASMGATVLLNVFPFEAIYPLAILAGICDSFFEPALSSAIPDIVPADSLSQANAARSVSMTLTQLVGNSLGGLLYALLTGPVMILINGISFLYASVTQLFMKIPFTGAAVQKKHILRDMLDGVQYTFRQKGLRTLLLACMALNFFSVAGLTLLTPMFDATPGFGAKMYGFLMGVFTAGAVLGMVVLSIVKIKPAQRSTLFGAATMLLVLCMAPMGMIRSIAWLFPLAFVAGVCHAVVNMMIQTILQATVPSENRGKVFGIVGTISGALMPLAMALSGIVAQAVGLRETIVFCFSVQILTALPLVLDKSFKAFINTDTTAQTQAAAEPDSVVADLAPAAEVQ